MSPRPMQIDLGKNSQSITLAPPSALPHPFVLVLPQLSRSHYPSGRIRFRSPVACKTLNPW